MNLRKIVLALITVCICSASYAQMNRDTLLVLRNDGVVDYKNQKKYHLKDVILTGVSTMNSRLIINSLGLHKGDSLYIPSQIISDAIKKLWSYKQYSDVKVFVKTDGHDAILEFKLKDRPFVSSWSISGISSGQKKELLEILRLTRNMQFSEYTIESSEKIIKDFYAEKGFYNTNVATTILKDTLTFRGRSYVNVNFNINKKVKVKVQEILFEGVSDDIDAKKLKRQMKNNKEKKLVNMFKGAKFRSKLLAEDKSSIIEYMQSNGYRNATILKDSIYQITEDRVGIKFTVFQGKKYYYRNILWTGNEKYNVDYLNRILLIDSGSVYDSKELNMRLGLDFEAAIKGLVNVSSLYQDDGYMNFTIMPIEQEVAADSVDIEIKILEGEQFSINSVVLKGNLKTNDKVVRRELFVRPGEIYSQQLLINSVRGVQSLPTFSQGGVNPIPQITPGSNNLTDITFDLEEGTTDSFSFSGGFGAGMIVLGVGISFKNLSLRKLFNKGAWTPYPSGDMQSFDLNIQTNGTYYKNISFSFLEPWLGGKKPNQLGFNFYYSAQTNGVTVFDQGNAQFATLGTSLTYGKRLSWPDPYFYIRLALGYQHYDMTNWRNFVFTNGISHIVSLEAMISRNSINSPIYPSSGSEFTLSASATPPYSIFKPEGYYRKDLTDQQRYRFVEFFKLNFKARWYQSLTSDEKLVFHVGAQMGYLGHYNPNAISPFEGYSVGGSGVGGYNLYGVTYVGLRGYPDGALTPYADVGEQARIYTKYTAELRYPIVNSPAATMFVLAFAEAGNAASGWRVFNPFELKKSAGIGLRMLLPYVGLFGIDFGYGFDRLPGEFKASGFEFHFSMGQEF